MPETVQAPSTEFSLPFVRRGDAFTLNPGRITPAVIEAGITARRNAIRKHSQGLQDIDPEFKMELVADARVAATVAQATSYLYAILCSIDPKLPETVANTEALLPLLSADQFKAMLIAIGGKTSEAAGPLAKTPPN